MSIGTRIYTDCECRKYGRGDANVQSGIVAQRRSTVVENFQKHGETRDGELHILFVLERVPQIFQPRYRLVLILSLSLSSRLPPSFPPSLILLGPADGFPHAHVPRGRPGEIMNETRTGKGETECVSRPSYSRFPTGAGTSARTQ